MTGFSESTSLCVSFSHTLIPSVSVFSPRLQTGVYSLSGGVFIRRVCQEAPLPPLLPQWMYSALAGAGKNEDWMWSVGWGVGRDVRFVMKFFNSVSHILSWGAVTTTQKLFCYQKVNSCFSAVVHWLFTCSLIRLSLPLTARYLPSMPKKPCWRRQQPPAHVRTPRSPLHQDRATGEAGDLRSNSTFFTVFMRHASLLRPPHWLLLNKIYITLTWFTHFC